VKANQAVIVWRWNGPGVYAGPQPQIDVVNLSEDIEEKWEWRSRLGWKWRCGMDITAEENFQLSLVSLFHDLTVLWDIPSGDVETAFYKIDEYQSLFHGEPFPYQKIKRKEAVCPTL